MDDQTLAQRGAHAGMAKSELSRRVTERVEGILNALINKHRSKDGLSGDEAKAGIAAICEMRLLLGDVNRDIAQGEEARKRLMAPSRDRTAPER